MSDEIQRMYTYKEVGQILKISEQTLRQWVSAGIIPFVKLGRAVRFTKDMVNNMMTNGVYTKGWSYGATNEIKEAK